MYINSVAKTYKKVMQVIAAGLCIVVSSVVMAVPTIQHWQTNNGSKVFFVAATEIPIVDIKVIFSAGSTRNGDHAGLSQLTNNLLDQGAAGLNADQISQGFDNVGTIYSASAQRDSATISLRSLSDAKILDAALTNFARVLVSPDFPEDALARQKNRMLLAIRSKQQSPSALAEDAFFSAVFAEHPYAIPMLGTKESVNSLTRDDVLSFHERYYVANNATVAIVGDLTQQLARSIVQRLLKGLPRGKKPQPIVAVDTLQAPASVLLNYPSSQTHIIFGQTGLKRGDADYFALYVGNYVLGGGGMVSRLFDEIREKRGLSYSVGSYFLPMRDKGVFMASLQTRSDQADAALEVLKNNIHEFINHGPTEAELVAAKKNIVGGFPLQLSSNKKIVNYIGMIGFYGLPINWFDTFNANINAISVEQVKDAFKRRLFPDKFVTVMVGPALQADVVRDTLP